MQERLIELYGWRQGGDYGIIGSPPSGNPSPTTGAYVPYPSYFAEQLASKIIQAGGNVGRLATNNQDLSADAVLEPNGQLDLMVINKSRIVRPDRPVPDRRLPALDPGPGLAIRRGPGQRPGAEQQWPIRPGQLPTRLTLNGSDFSDPFPQYLMTVLVLGKSSGSPAPSTTVASAPTIYGRGLRQPHPVTGTSTVLSVSATHPAVRLWADHTWAHRHHPHSRQLQRQRRHHPAGRTAATFGAAGTYTFQVTVADPSAYRDEQGTDRRSALTSIATAPVPAIVQAGGTEVFTLDRALDQFDNPRLDDAGLQLVGESGLRVHRREHRGFIRYRSRRGSCSIQASRRRISASTTYSHGISGDLYGPGALATGQEIQ